MYPVVSRSLLFPDLKPFFIPYQALEQGKLKKTETALLYLILCNVEEQGFPSALLP